jgi:hypothetical protein
MCTNNRKQSIMLKEKKTNISIQLGNAMTMIFHTHKLIQIIKFHIN